MWGETIFCKILLDALFDLLLETGSAGKSDFRHAFLSDVNSTLFIPKKKRGASRAFFAKSKKRNRDAPYSYFAAQPVRHRLTPMIHDYTFRLKPRSRVQPTLAPRELSGRSEDISVRLP
jgi:hypothetical protein